MKITPKKNYRRTQLKILYTVLVLSVCSFAQTSPLKPSEDEGASSGPYRLDFIEQSQQYQEKSLGLALLQSALVPGAGEIYLDRHDRAQWFLGAEILSWAAVIFSYQYGENQLTRLKSYAKTHARAQGVSRDPDLLQKLGEYRFSNRSEGLQPASDFGQDEAQDQILQGEEANSGELYWDWGSAYEYSGGTDPYIKYKGMLSNYRTSQIAFQVSIGMLALNRLLSLLDVFQLYRSGRSQVSFHALPSQNPTLIMAVQF